MTYWSIRHVSSSSCSLVWKPTSFCQNSEIFALCGVVVTHWFWWCISGAMGYNGGGGVAMGAMVELVECGSKPAAHGARPPLTVHPTGQRWALSGQIDRYTKCMIVTPMFVTTSVWFLHQCLLQQVYDCTLLHHVRGRVRVQVLFNFHLDPSSCNSPCARVK